ncbi:MAG TPA: ClbS/DfsB family four-helix bundle protein [Thermomicrobiales bacterium]|nr:ClbS/DfsB family four-helix bundle protein [Thermomicrobiales bacterium]
MSTSNPNKGEILAFIEGERTAWEALLAEVGERRMTEPGAFGEWTFKDLVAHLNAWEGQTLAQLEAAAWGRPEPADPWPISLGDDDDAINAWIFEHNRERLLGDVVAESREHYARLAEIVQMLPDDALTDPRRFAWTAGKPLGAYIVDGDYFAHVHAEHEPAIRAWLAAGQ